VRPRTTTTATTTTTTTTATTTTTTTTTAAAAAATCRRTVPPTHHSSPCIVRVEYIYNHMNRDILRNHVADTDANHAEHVKIRI